MLQKQKLFYLKLNKQLDTDFILKLCRKRFCTTNHVRHLVILIDDKLSLNNHANIVSKPMRGNSILSKLRYYVNKKILRTSYFAIFHS